MQRFQENILDKELVKITWIFLYHKQYKHFTCVTYQKRCNKSQSFLVILYSDNIDTRKSGTQQPYMVIEYVAEKEMKLLSMTAQKLLRLPYITL